MQQRCRNPNRWDFKHYGGRGIHVCEEWSSWHPFVKWAMGNGYDESLCIDRTDNDGPYSPKNCRWVTQTEQYANRSKKNDGTNNGMSKLTEADVRAIRQDNRSSYAIAPDYGVNHCTVWNVKAGKSWKHIE